MKKKEKKIKSQRNYYINNHTSVQSWGMGEEGICSGWRVRKNRFDILSSNNKQQHFFIKILELGGLRVAWNE